MPTRLTIIIPVLEEEHALPACLQAVATQRAHDWEVDCVVVDGGSEDRSVDIAKAAGAQVFFAARGRGSQLRHGAEAATGEWLLFLHADVRLPADALAALSAARQRPGVQAGAFRVIHEVSASAGAWTRACLRLADRRSTTRRLPYGDQAIFTSAALYHQVGGIPERPLMEDIHFARSLAKATRLERLPQAVHASGRRFEHSPLRTTLCWWTFPTLDRLGLSPRLLAWLYGRPRSC